VAFLAPGPVWINVQHVSGEAANTSVRVQRYRRAINQNLADGTKAPQPAASASTARTGSDTRWDIDDVIEASSKMPAEAVQAALSDVRHGFNLNRNTLVALDDAGVSEGVIDLMVALTFPKRFVVDRPSGGGGSMGISTGGGWFDPFMSPLAYGNYGNCYTPYGYGYRSYYSMCGGGYYSSFGYGPGYYDNYYGYPGNGWVIIDNNPVGGVAPSTVEGRVVNGRGYTQIRPRNPEPAPMRVGNGGNGTAAGYSGASSGTSGVSSQGYSSGSSGGGSSSSGGDSGRTAVARPPGGGN